MTEHSTQVAGDLVSRLYDDVGTIHENIQRYEPTDVLKWLNGMQGELQAFAGRMASMCGAAIDHETFDGLCGELRSHAFTTVRAEALAPSEQHLPLAWVLIARRD